MFSMIYELVLTAFLLGAGYWGLYFVRERPHGTATFGIMLIASAVLAGLGLLGRHGGPAWLGVAGAIGVGGGLCLLVLGPLVRAAARRLVTAEWIGAARRLLDLAELLAPGSGVAEEKAMLRAMTEIREGRIEQTVDALTAAKERAPAGARLAIDERIAMLYLAAYRWSDAIAHAEVHLFGAPPPDDGAGSLRHELGIAPPVWVELLGAYARTGDLERAAHMVARLEDVCVGRDDAAVWLHRARVMFLALAGRTEAVRALVAPRQARHMTASARSYWIAVAHEHHGDREQAASAYERARSRSRGRPRELIDQALARLAEPRRTELAAVASAVVARIEASPLPPRIETRSQRRRATWLITATLLAVSATTAIAVGATSDLGVLIRAGALLHGAVAGGEWWRIVSCVFVHVGPVHLVFNVIGLIMLGRLAEDMFGSARTIALFGVAGVAGALASYLAAPTGLSAGASGAVFGLLGAVFVEITWHRERYRAVWKRGMWGALAVFAVGQLAYGFLYPMIDQWAHGSGLLAGALLGVVLSPSARRSRAGLYLGRALALVFAAFVLTAAVMVARTSLADTLDAGPRVRHVVDKLAITAPAGWRSQLNQLFHPDLIAIVEVEHEPGVDLAARLKTWSDNKRREWSDERAEVTTARARVIALPEGWQGEELEAELVEVMGYRQRLRIIVCGRVFGDTIVVMAIQVPEVVATAAPAFLEALIASTGPA